MGNGGGEKRNASRGIQIKTDGMSNWRDQVKGKKK
jgi:hypothetical protein